MPNRVSFLLSFARRLVGQAFFCGFTQGEKISDYLHGSLSREVSSHFDTCTCIVERDRSLRWCCSSSGDESKATHTGRRTERVPHDQRIIWKAKVLKHSGLGCVDRLADWAGVGRRTENAATAQHSLLLPRSASL
jgi:hypothetical protein